MKNYSLIFLAVLGSALLFSRCDDVIAKDITEELPVVVLPQSEDTIEANPVHFKWQAMSGATKYHLEIVSPSFDNIDTYALDSVVTGTNFFFSLDSNEYQFRLTALNAGYESQTTNPITFWVGTSAGVPQTSVVLDAPAADAYVNGSFDGKFKWVILNNADHYTFELHEGGSFSNPTVDIQPDVESWTVTSHTGAQLPEGDYIWGVKAYMTNGDETVYTKRRLYVDKTNPGIATDVIPSNGTTLTSGTITFTWDTPTDTGIMQSPVKSVLEISTNSNFSDIIPSVPVTGESAQRTLPAGTYYWRVRLVDEAGNSGLVSATYFTLNLL